METDEGLLNLTKHSWVPFVISRRLDVGPSSDEAHSRIITRSLLVFAGDYASLILVPFTSLHIVGKVLMRYIEKET